MENHHDHLEECADCYGEKYERVQEYISYETYKEESPIAGVIWLHG